MSEVLLTRYHKSSQLLERARRLIPGCHHLSGRPLVEDGPMYLERGQGCRAWDVDGNEYIDYLMAFGPFLLGYAHAEVDEAAIQQLRRGKLLSMNHPLHLDFIERLVDRLPGSEMGIFFKTGSEATTAALRLAGRATGRRKVARCGYHGWHDWCLPLEDYVPAGLENQILEFRAQQPASLQALVDEHDLAAVIVSPEMVLDPQPATFQRLQEIARRAGAVLIFDEVKTALRTRPGSIQQYLNIRPDLTTLSKALGNGWPVAAVVGRREIMEGGSGMHYSATFHGDSASLAASLKVLDILDREPVADHVWQMGEQLIEGLNQLAATHGVAARAYGEPLPPMPFLAFESEQQKAVFYSHMLQRGILMHPRHMWFISYAHRPEHIQRTLDAADGAMHKASAVL